MKLYLSSQDLGNHIDRLHEMVGDNKKVLFIGNAEDYLPVQERTEHLLQRQQEFEAAGFDFYELDLRNYFGEPESLAPIVANAGLVWGSGGNTFILRRALYYSGLDEILSAGLKNDQFVYGGSSAGSIIMTKTLHGTENGDDPYSVPKNYQAEIIWDGLGLIYPQLVPHYQSEWFGDEAQAMADYCDTNGLKYETLQDGDVYIVDGDYEEKLT